MSSAEEHPSTVASPRARLGLGAAVVVVLLALTITVAIGILRGAAAPVEAVTIDDAGSTDAAAPASVFVHVSGSVVAPGLYVLDEGARVIDAVAAAGGFAAGADETAVNLARPLSDGEQLLVPTIGAARWRPAPPLPVTAGSISTPRMPRSWTPCRGSDRRWLSASSSGATRTAGSRASRTSWPSPGIGDKMLETLRDLVTV